MKASVCVTYYTTFAMAFGVKIEDRDQRLKHKLSFSFCFVFLLIKAKLIYDFRDSIVYIRFITMIYLTWYRITNMQLSGLNIFWHIWVCECFSIVFAIEHIYAIFLQYTTKICLYMLIWIVTKRHNRVSFHGIIYRIFTYNNSYWFIVNSNSRI